MHDKVVWRPTASIETLRARAELLTLIRAFFAHRGVLEVDTPLMAAAAVTDPFIEAIEVVASNAQPNRYLQTSPEYAMKRLLAAGSGPIYQLCKAFRQGEVGCRHNPEFTLLEWYRPGFDEQLLMDEVQTLMQQLLSIDDFIRISYGELFDCHLAVNPHTASVATLAAIARQHGSFSFADEALDKDGWLDVLMTHVIEPALNPQQGVFIYDYPASQAALAQLSINESGDRVARRFEFYCAGVELANGYFELLDSQELATRGEADNAKRRALNLPEMAIDRCLLAAMTAGMPSCAGVAMGVDRLLMIKLGIKHIAQAMSFDTEHA